MTVDMYIKYIFGKAWLHSDVAYANKDPKAKQKIGNEIMRQCIHNWIYQV